MLRPIGKTLTGVECGKCSLGDSYYWLTFWDNELLPGLLGWGESYAYVCKQLEPYYRLLHAQRRDAPH